jgi:DNA-binding transcriptional ArsR family regulator
MWMKASMSPALLDGVADRFRILGDATRLAILNTLLARGEMNVGELVAELNTSQANVSKHLRVLLDARIVGRRQVGTAAYYSIVDPTVSQLCDIVCDRLRQQAAAEAEAFAVS